MEPVSNLVASSAAIAPSFSILLWAPLLLIAAGLVIGLAWLIYADRTAASEREADTRAFAPSRREALATLGSPQKTRGPLHAARASTS